MALRNQPYIPLYVQDFLTDEKLMLCSAESVGVYIKIMCLMHKSEEYGTIKIKERFKQNQSKHKNFASFLSIFFPFSTDEIERSLVELTENKVLFYSENEEFLIQKRMQKDGELSEKRALAGSKGGKNVKNSNTKKLYNEPGYLYLVQSIENELVHKIGISKDPKKRLLQLKHKYNIELKMVKVFETNDMGTFEDNVLTAFNEHRDGEWITGLSSTEIIKVINNQNQSKNKSNTEIEYESETEVEIDNKNEKFNFKNELIKIGFEESLVIAWMQIRAKKKAVNSKIAFNSFLSEYQKTGKLKNEVLKIIVEKQWKGFEAAWIIDTKTNQQIKTEPNRNFE